MSQFHFIDTGAWHESLSVSAPQAQPLLAALGIQTGHWAEPIRRVSSVPQLHYARPLDALQRRFDSALTDRIQLRPGPRGALIWPEPEGEHAHDECEVRVVLAGWARFIVRTPATGRSVELLAEPGDWIALPPGLPHTLEPSREPRLDMLRLFSRREALAERRSRVEPANTALRAMAA